MANILILEDVEDNFQLVKHALGPAHNLTWANSITAAKAAFNDRFDLLLVDVGLPDGDGFEFCDWIRSNLGNWTVPIIFITGHSATESRIAGYMIGGDDYISKPFNVLDLKARIEAKLRRSRSAATLTVSVGDLNIDLRAQRVKIKDAGVSKDIDLTPIEFKILSLLVSDIGRVFSRDEILNKVWGQDVYVFHRSVDTHVSKLRRKLLSQGDLIQSVHSLGYKLTAPDVSKTA